MSFNSYVLQEVASQHALGGAGLSTIRTLVDGRQKLMLSEVEVVAALHQLIQLGHITRSGDVYLLSASTEAIVPRTSSGDVSMDWREWERLSRTLDSRPDA